MVYDVWAVPCALTGARLLVALKEWQAYATIDCSSWRLYKLYRISHRLKMLVIVHE